MIHQYKSNGYNIVLDINSGSVHVVDDVVYDVVPLFEENGKQEIIDSLKSKYAVEEIEEAIEEVKDSRYLSSIYYRFQKERNSCKGIMSAYCS